MEFALVRGRQICTQLSIFEEVSQNCFVYDVVKFKNWEILAELLRFWCYQVQFWGSQAELQRQLQRQYATLHYLHYTTLHHTTLQYATLDYTTLDYTTLTTTTNYINYNYKLH